jgi:tRNA uridine 5-carbamoylmethylation protein Kti12
MKLIFLYGPPASGKLTVAKEIKKITDYKLLYIFHNRSTRDSLESIFDKNTKAFYNLADKVRLDFIEAAARENISGLIFTFCYAKTLDDKFVKQVIKKAEKHKGEVCFIRLYCDKEKLFTRLKDSIRKRNGKLKNKKILEGLLKKYELFSDVPFKNNLSIDNSKLSAKKTAEKIKKHFKLKK